MCMALIGIAACAADATEPVPEADITSTSMTFLDLRFDASVVGTASESDDQRKKTIVAQLFYLSGELDKAHGGHGRFGFVELSDVRVEPLDGGLERVTYNAVLPIAWPQDRSIPETYRVVAPLRVDATSLAAFNQKYTGRCGEAHYGSDNLWYDFKPVTSGCAIDAGDMIDTVAAVSKSQNITTDRRPEYERFWDDGAFKVVIVHGTDASWGLDENDTGVRQYLEYLQRMQEAHPAATISKLETTSNIWDHWKLEAQIEGHNGQSGALVVNALLTGEVQSIGSDFDTRFAELSADADFIAYGGHSGLSKNITALAAKVSVEPRHYMVMFLDGCSTFAYLDRTLADKKASVNGADVDPDGTKFLDVIVNAQPVPWYAGAASLFTLTSTLPGKREASYLDILESLSQSGMPLVAGEEDNPVVP